MNHQQAFKKISLYIDRQLPSEEITKIEKHIKICKTCKQELSDLKKVIKQLSKLPIEKTSSDFLENIKKKLAKEERKSMLQKIISYPTHHGRAIAALTTLVFSLFIIRALIDTPKNDISINRASEKNIIIEEKSSPQPVNKTIKPSKKKQAETPRQIVTTKKKMNRSPKPKQTMSSKKQEKNIEHYSKKEETDTMSTEIMMDNAIYEKGSIAEESSILKRKSDTALFSKLSAPTILKSYNINISRNSPIDLNKSILILTNHFTKKQADIVRLNNNTNLNIIRVDIKISGIEMKRSLQELNKDFLINTKLPLQINTNRQMYLFKIYLKQN
jgi:hypothetical protein